MTLKERGVTKEVLHKINIQQSVKKSTKSIIIISLTNLNFFYYRTSVTFTIGTTRERRKGKGKCYRNDQNIPKIDNIVTREMYKLN